MSLRSELFARSIYTFEAIIKKKNSLTRPPTDCNTFNKLQVVMMLSAEALSRCEYTEYCGP